MKACIFILVALCSLSRQAFADDPASNDLIPMRERGDVSWKEWSFRYYIENTKMEGLTVTDVSYRGRKVLATASLPVVRVKYKGNAKHVGSGCGPFPDRFFNRNILGLLTPAFSTGTIRPYPKKAGLTDVVSFTTTNAEGIETLSLYVYAEIGGYLLWHGWNFRTDGSIAPLLHSAGWSCTDGVVKNDHRHHPYFRFVFRIDDGENDLWEASGPEGQPPIFRKVLNEEDFAALPGQDLRFVVGSRTSSRHAIVSYPPAEDASIDSKGPPWFGFATVDAGVRLYKSEEDLGWNIAATAEFPYLTPLEPITSGYTVLWVARHLSHNYKPGEDDKAHEKWHGRGPMIQLVEW